MKIIYYTIEIDEKGKKLQLLENALRDYMFEIQKQFKTVKCFKKCEED